MKNDYSRKELMKVPLKVTLDPLTGVSGIYVIPTGKKHDSGWACMYLVAEFTDERPMVRFAGSCDDLSFDGSKFRMDCVFPSRILHIWNSYGTFSVIGNLSSITLEAENEERQSPIERWLST